MKNPFHGSIFAGLRVRLMLLALLITLPPLGLVLHHGIEERRLRRLEVLGEFQAHARNAALVCSQVVDEARQTLRHLSLMPPFQRPDPKAAAAILAPLLRQNERLTALVALRPNGDVFASAPVLSRPLNAADLPWFRRLLQRRDFVIGERMIGPGSGRPTVVFGHPVLDAAGRLSAVVAAGLDIEGLGTTLGRVELPEGANLTLTDSDGTVIFRHPDPQRLIGKNLQGAEIFQAITARREGVLDGVGLDGRRRLFGFTTVGDGAEAIHVCVSVPEEVAFATERQENIRNLAWAASACALALLAAWLFGGVFIVVPARRLQDFSAQLADGNFVARTGQPHAPGEFGALARNLDRMARSLQRHEAERDRADEALQASEAKYRDIVEASFDGVLSVDARQGIVLWNGGAERIFGYAAAEMLGQGPGKILAGGAREEIEKGLAGRFNGGDSPLAGKIVAARGIRRDGTSIPVELSISFVCRDRAAVATALVRDVSERERAAERLRRKESDLRLLIDRNVDGVMIVDRGGVMRFLNPAAATLFGRPPGALIGNEIGLPLVSGEAAEMEICAGDGALRTAEMRAAAIQWEDEDAFLVSLRDVSERKRAEENLRASLLCAVQAIAAIVELKDPYTAGHQRRVAALALRVAEKLGMTTDRCEGVRIAGMIHDIGKVSIPTEILSKPGKISALEYDLIKGHVRSGFDILKPLGFPWPVDRIVFQHHERTDGTGYPRGLAGMDILPEARILAVADVVEAMATHRPYRSALGLDAALAEIETNRGRLYDPDVVDACLKLFRQEAFRFDS